MNVRTCAFRHLLAVAVVLIAGTANADIYPTQTVKFVVPFPAGGTTDILARVFAQRMSQIWGQPVVVENRTGAGGIIGSESVARSIPNGYTILMGTIGTHGVATSLYKQIPYDPEKDFAPISLVATFPSLLAINPSLPVKNVKELTNYAKANPGKLTYASNGAGTGSHLAGEMLRKFADINIVHVPYRGSSPAMTDLLAGQVAMFFDSIPSILPYVRSGRLLALGVTGPSRTKAAPEVPTMVEGGVPGFNQVTWVAVFAPKGTPPDVVGDRKSVV